MTPSVRWGLLGTAHINRRLIPAMRTARRSVIAAVASRDVERARRYAEEWQIPTAHDRYDALLHDSSVDAVYVPLPNALHVEWTLRSLDAGKHVLCEKPLALTADDVDRIAAVAQARERVVVEAFMYRHEPLIPRLLEFLRNGGIGSLTHISSGFTFQQHRQGDVRLDPALGGGSLWDVGCYAVSIARLVAASEPQEAFGWTSLCSTGVDETFTGLLRFAEPLTATVHCSFRSPYRTWLEIDGREGWLRVSDPFKPSSRVDIEVHRDDGRETIAVEGSPALFVRQIEDFVAAVLDGRSPTVSLAESRGNAAAVSALYASSRTGRPVAI